MWKRSYLNIFTLLASLWKVTLSLPVVENAVATPPREAELAAKAPRINAMIQKAAAVNRSAWTVTVDSQEASPSNPGTNVLDGNNSTFWHTEYTPVTAPLPHNLTIDMHQTLNLNAFVYTPRQDGNSNGNIGEHVVQVSADNTTWTTVAFGRYVDDATTKTTPFSPIAARYFRILALTEAGNRGPWTSVAEINVNTVASLPTISPATQGTWSPTIEFPIVPVQAAILPATGQLLVWSSYLWDDFEGTSNGVTQTAYYDPVAKTVTQVTVSNIGHDMFCPGISRGVDGSILVTGGNTANVTTSFDLSSNSWVPKANMQIPRGYQASATVSDGRIFTIGGSWSGGEGGKNGEIYSSSSNTWTLLPGAPVAPMLTADAQGVYRADNHAWLFGWKSGYVFQAGPSKAMNWYSTTGIGNQSAAGTRASDGDSMCGNAVMYDAVAGKILTAGGSPSYQDSNATSNAHIITIGASGAAPTVQTIGNMAYTRAFANGVVLPDGQVLIVGGQSYAVPFSDDTAQLVPELFNPTTNKFTQVAPIAVARVYHSVSLLMPDGTVFNGGGGLCGSCGTNHFDGQIWSPPYLYTSSGALATRPVISSVSATSVAVGKSFTATTNSAVTSFALIRYGSVTHTVDTDQRRISLTPVASGNTYKLTVPSSTGVALPGYYMLFALNSAGVPSISQTILVTAT